MAKVKQRISTCLWFDGQAEEAARFYASIFKNSKVGEVSRYDEAGAKASGQPKGSAMAVPFTLDGHEFLGLNGGPIFKFNEAMSLIIHCESQEEVDHYWNRLTADGGQEVQCGWLKDKYGVSWQVTPTVLPEMLKDKDPAKAKRVMEAMLQMKKISIPELKRAYDGGA
jgi:predicted 3-demethylubiquinone-9 3-methyltransferase (glyoxalase superfamily)